MAGTDPKKTRDFGPMTGREDYDADEDPLVELARIVSEDGGFSGRTPERPRAEPSEAAEPRIEQPQIAEPNVEEPLVEQHRVMPAEPLTDRDAFSSDLEAELLHELETSFASAHEAPRQEPPAEEPAPSYPVEPPETEQRVWAEPAPAPSAPAEDNADDLLRSIEEQLSQFEQRVRTESFAVDERSVTEDAAELLGSTHDEDAEPAPEPRDEFLDEPREAARSEYQFRGPASAGWDRQEERADETSSHHDALEVPTSVADAPAPADLFGRPEATAEEPDETLVEENIELADEAQSWESSRQHEEAPAQLAAADLAGLEAELSRELDPGYGRADRSQWHEEDTEPEDEPRVAPAAVITPEPGMQPPPRPAAPPPPRARSARGLVTAAAIVVVVLLGGAGALYMRSVEQSPSGPPPVIAAQEGPVKIEPAATPSDDGGETVGEAVYDQVAGRASEAEETIVDGAEEPREIARIVLPESRSEGAPAAISESGGEAAEPEAEASTASEGQGGAEEFGPRRVSTYVVRPDGTIVSTAEAGGGAVPDTSAQEMATAQTEAMEPKPVATVSIDEPRTAGTAAPVAENEPTASMEGMASTDGEDVMEQPPAVEQPNEDVADAPTEIAAVEPAEESRPATEAEETSANEPDVAVAEPEPGPPPPTASSGYLVQLSAQTSQEAAQTTFAALKRRHATILGNLDANIQRADLGDRGIYYRVRVGPWAERADAIGVCEALKSAGADCYVTQ